MPQNEFVVQFNEQTDLYMTVFNPEYSQCQWGNLENAITFTSLEKAQEVATMINSGTVGVPRP